MRTFGRLASALLLPLVVLSAGQARARQPAPVVATWFSVLHPSVGSKEALHVYFSRGTTPLAGAHVMARLTYGKSHLDLGAGRTNHHGDASASFRVPRKAKGKVMDVVATVTYRGHRYLGSNHVQVKA